MMTIPEAADWLAGRDLFLILTHRRPDGDTIGCAAALAQGLREQGKTAYILYNPEITKRYARYAEDYWAPEGYKPEHVIAVDTASYELFTKNAEMYKGAVSLCIDHHPSNTFYAENTCLDETRASCGEIIYDILFAISGDISAKTAESVYLALSTDTGCFVFANTTADTLRIASLAVKAGAPHRQINKLIFRTRTRSRVKIEAMIFSGLEFHFDGAAAIAVITRKMLEETGADEDDMDDITSVPGSVEGVVAGITIRELTNERDCKISVRTMPQVNAQEICKRFGGGGHKMAAGASVDATVAEIKEEMLKVLAGFFPVC